MNYYNAERRSIIKSSSLCFKSDILCLKICSSCPYWFSVIVVSHGFLARFLNILRLFNNGIAGHGVHALRIRCHKPFVTTGVTFLGRSFERTLNANPSSGIWITYFLSFSSQVNFDSTTFMWGDFTIGSLRFQRNQQVSS